MLEDPAYFLCWYDHNRGHQFPIEVSLKRVQFLAVELYLIQMIFQTLKLLSSFSVQEYPMYFKEHQVLRGCTLCFLLFLILRFIFLEKRRFLNMNNKLT